MARISKLQQAVAVGVITFIICFLGIRAERQRAAQPAAVRAAALQEDPSPQQ